MLLNAVQRHIYVLLIKVFNKNKCDLDNWLMYADVQQKGCFSFKLIEITSAQSTVLNSGLSSYHQGDAETGVMFNLLYNICLN